MSFNLEFFPTPTHPPQIDSSHMLRSCVIVFREAKAALQDAKDIFVRFFLVSLNF
jgi:hypothetical protein